MEKNILIVIPARGNSKGIPRKNLRLLAGKPLISYSILTALSNKFNAHVCVSTDDDEISFFAKSLNAHVVERSPTLATDSITLDPVIYDAYQQSKKELQQEFELIVTMQPTSPLLTGESINRAIQHMLDLPEIDSLISVVEDTHLRWLKTETGFEPDYEERLNRQYLTPAYKETGGFLITRNTIITANSRLGANIDLFPLPENEAIDIDTHADWGISEFHLKRKKIVYAVTGNQLVGMGHIYNGLTIANGIVNHELVFVTDNKSRLAYEKLRANNYLVIQQENQSLLNTVINCDPDLVINDILDTEEAYVDGLIKHGTLVVNIEDKGSGARKSNALINAMYPESSDVLNKNEYNGAAYCCLSQSFYLTQPHAFSPQVSEVLITYGGVDPLNLTELVLNTIYDTCLERNINITVILGMGYQHELDEIWFERCNIYKDIKNMPEFMLNKDVAFTSAGRTTFELAYMGVPAIVISQNERETTHFFASSEHGFINLGLGHHVDAETIKNNFVELITNNEYRKQQRDLMLQTDIRKGKENVLKLINNLLNE